MFCRRFIKPFEELDSRGGLGLEGGGGRNPTIGLAAIYDSHRDKPAAHTERVTLLLQASQPGHPQKQ